MTKVRAFVLFAGASIFLVFWVQRNVWNTYLTGAPELSTKVVDDSWGPLLEVLHLISSMPTINGTLPATIPPIDNMRAIRSAFARSSALSEKGTTHFKASFMLRWMRNTDFSFAYKEISDPQKAGGPWLFRIQGQEVSYATPIGGCCEAWADFSDFEAFRNAHFVRNMLAVTLRFYNMSFKQPQFLLVNVWDEPVLPSFPGGIVTQEAPSLAPYEKNKVPPMHHNDWYPLYPGWYTNSLEMDKYKKPGRLVDSHGSFNARINDNPPVFSWSIVPNRHGDILVPNRHQGNCGKGAFAMFEREEIPWALKKNQFTFLFGDADDSDIRSKIVQHVKTRQARFLHTYGVEFDFRATLRDADASSSQSYYHHNLNLTSRNSPYEQSKSKYLLLVDGVVAAFRSTWYLRTGSCIFSTGFYLDVRTQLLEPWIHFIPVSPDLSDFEGKLRLVVQNPKYAEWVATNALTAGRTLTGDDNGNSFDKLYWHQILTTNSHSFTFEDDVDASFFTAGASCETWVDGATDCLTREYACDGVFLDGYPSEGRIHIFTAQGNRRPALCEKSFASGADAAFILSCK